MRRPRLQEPVRGEFSIRPESAIFFACYHAACASHYSPRPSHHHRFPACASWSSTFCGRRVGSHQTSAPDREALAPPCTKPPRLGSADRRILFAMDKAESASAAAIALKPSTVLQFHRALVQRKYRLLFSPKRRVKPGPKGPNPDVIRAVVDMKQRNPTWGCPRIAEQIALAFDVCIKDVVRRILAAHYYPSSDGSGPSWLTFIGHLKDSLHSIDLFRCESVALWTFGSIHSPNYWIRHPTWHRGVSANEETFLGSCPVASLTKLGLGLNQLKDV